MIKRGKDSITSITDIFTLFATGNCHKPNDHKNREWWIPVGSCPRRDLGSLSNHETDSTLVR